MSFWNPISTHFLRQLGVIVVFWWLSQAGFLAAQTPITVAGTGVPGFSGDGGPASLAQLNAGSERFDVAVDTEGNLYIADVGNSCIRKVDATTGVITTLAGRPGLPGFSGDSGPATQAQLNPSQSFPAMGVEVDKAGNLYIADTGNNRIRRVDMATGLITTVAGVGSAGSAGDGGLAVSASLNNPVDIDIDELGNLFIADTRNHLIRRVDGSSGIITTVAGSSTSESDWGFLGDGGPAVQAKMAYPWTVAIDLRVNENLCVNGMIRVRCSFQETSRQTG